MTRASRLPWLKWALLPFLLLILAFAFRQMAAFWPLQPVWPDGEVRPYGFYPTGPTADHFTQQDFAFHFQYFQQIWDRAQPQPYHLAEQEKMVRNWNPALTSGMPHAYSPVALVLMRPLLSRPPGLAYLDYLFFTWGEMVALVALLLVPRAQNAFQLLLLIPALLNWSFLTALYMGQFSLFSTGCLALLWWLLQREKKGGEELAVAILLWALCAKPSIGLVGLALALGCRAVRPLLGAGGLLLLTWVLLADRYGGFWHGLLDYSALLNHYYRAALPVYFQNALPPGLSTNANAFLLTFFPGQEAVCFGLSRMFFLGGTGLCVVLGWRNILSRPELFQALVWCYLLFSPHLLVAEDWVIVLLLVEGRFFRPAHGMFLKAFLLILLLNQRVPYAALCHLSWRDPSFYYQIGYLAKVALAGWWGWETWRNKSAASPVLSGRLTEYSA